MTWREFQLRRFAYERQRKEEWRHTREIVYWIYLSIPTKEAKINKEQFFPIDDSKGKSNVKASQFARKFLEEQQKEYYRQKNGSRI